MKDSSPAYVLEAPSHTLAERGGWQPIETAPKDGRPFLASRDGADIGAIVVARKKPQWPGFHSVPGDYTLKSLTHWMPLPSPPYERAGTGEQG